MYFDQFPFSKEDVVALCQLLNWSLPSYYPLVFPNQHRSGRLGCVPVLKEMTASTSSISLLKRLLKSREHVIVPKLVLLKDEETNQISQIPTEMLRPNSEFCIEDSGESYILKKYEALDNSSSFDNLNESFQSDASYSSDRSDLHHEDHSSDSDDSDTHSTSMCSRVVDEEPVNLENESHNENRDDDEITEVDEQIETPNNSLIESLLHILPADFNRGEDGLGSRTIIQRKAASYFLEPWKFTESELYSLVRVTKVQFFNLVKTCVGVYTRSYSKLNIFASCFLMLLKLTNHISYEMIATLFCLPKKSSAFDIFYRHVLQQFKFNCNIPSIIFNNTINQSEVDKLLVNVDRRTPMFYRILLKDIEDPSGRDRRPVALNIDGTYFDIEGSEDNELQKYMYYQPRANHVAKFISITDLTPKFVGFLPIASSQTPSSGDGLLTAKHIELEHRRRGTGTIGGARPQNALKISFCPD